MRIISNQIAFEVVGPIIVVAYRDKQVSEAAFDEYLATLPGELEAKKGGSMAALIFSPTLSAKQRVAFSEMAKKHAIDKIPIAMIADSTLIRASLTAYSWLTGAKAKAFSSTEDRAAVEWLATHQREADTAAVLASLRKAVAAVRQSVPAAAAAPP